MHHEELSFSGSKTFLFEARPNVPDGDLARVLTSLGLRSALESLPSGGVITSGEVHRSVIAIATFMAISTLAPGRSLIAAQAGILGQGSAAWDAPEVDASFAGIIPDPIDQELRAESLIGFAQSLLKGAYRVPGLDGRRIAEGEVCDRDMPGPDMTAVSNSMMNYIYARLLLFRGGDHEGGVLE